MAKQGLHDKLPGRTSSRHSAVRPAPPSPGASARRPVSSPARRMRAGLFSYPDALHWDVSTRRRPTVELCGAKGAGDHGVVFLAFSLDVVPLLSPSGRMGPALFNGAIGAISRRCSHAVRAHYENNSAAQANLAGWWWASVFRDGGHHRRFFRPTSPIGVNSQPTASGDISVDKDIIMSNARLSGAPISG